VLFSKARWRELAEHLELPRRQRESAWLICRGCSNRQIAQKLGISDNTVRVHVRSLFARLKAHDRVGVVVRLVLADRALSEGDGRGASP